MSDVTRLRFEHCGLLVDLGSETLVDASSVIGVHPYLSPPEIAHDESRAVVRHTGYRRIDGWVVLFGGHLLPYYVTTRTLRKRLCAAGWRVIR